MLKNTSIDKKRISTKIKLTVNKAIFVPILTCRCEIWVLGLAGKNRIRNTSIREQLQVQLIVKRIKDCQLKWFGHLTRMKTDIPVKKVWEPRRNERRARERPWSTWDENLNMILADTGQELKPRN